MRTMTDKTKKIIDFVEPADEYEAVPLIFPEDFDTPPDLDERILREMAELSKELDEIEKKRKERKAHATRFILRVSATAAILALIVMVTPLRNYMVSASNDVKSWIQEMSSESNNKISDIQSHENNDTEGYIYTIKDTDFKGGIAHGDTLYIIPSGDRDSIPITHKVASVTNTGDKWGRDYFHVSVTDSNRIVISVDKRVQKHAHLYVEIYYEDGSVYEHAWDLITSRPMVRFNPVKDKRFVGDVFEPKYYVVVMDEDENVKTANYIKGTNRIKWYTEDDRYTDDPRLSIDEKGIITCLASTYKYTAVKADMGYGNVAVLQLWIFDKKD